MPFKKILQDIIKQALILSKFQTGKINVLSSVKPQNYHVVYVLLLCIYCTLFLYLNAVLLYVTLICISFYDVTQPDCSPELFPLNCYFSISKLLDCRCSGAQQLWCKHFFFLKSRISLCLNNRRKHSGQENFSVLKNENVCENSIIHSILSFFPRPQPFFMLRKSFVLFSIQHCVSILYLWYSL